MSEQTENNGSLEEAELQDNSVDFIESTNDETGKGGALAFIFPLVICVFMFVGFTQEFLNKKTVSYTVFDDEIAATDNNSPKINFSALLASEEFSKNLRDTIYTNDNLWLEFRIDQQQLYVHYRNGRIIKYPVSSGIPGAHKSVDSRPGLFAIFHMNQAHKSSQFNSQLNYFMAFNMGVGFHGLSGTGYYVHLGIRPSSHGCIRMRNEDVKILFGQCKIGTLVLSHKGNTNRVVAFAPEGFKNEAEYTKEDYMNMLAYNLGTIMEGKYFINPPKRFILDGTVIPSSGINIKSTEKIPEKQILPYAVVKIEMKTDFLNNYRFGILNRIKEPENLADKYGFTANDSLNTGNVQLTVAPEKIKKYVHNPIGILPYFPPDR